LCKPFHLQCNQESVPRSRLSMPLAFELPCAPFHNKTLLTPVQSHVWIVWSSHLQPQFGQTCSYSAPRHLESVPGRPAATIPPPHLIPPPLPPFHPRPNTQALVLIASWAFSWHSSHGRQ
jgi:hypothetical protein